MVAEMYIFIGVGVLGGTARALYGLMKAVMKGKEINLKEYHYKTINL